MEIIRKVPIRIGLDIDDVLADFWGGYCKYFDTNNNPEMLENYTITKNVERILKHDRNFWINLEVVDFPNFVPTLYCTKRVNNKVWTRKFLEINGFPIKPIYQIFTQSKNKADLIKGRVDIFIDDSLRNVIQCNKEGLPTLLYNTERTKDFPMFKIFSLDKEEIIDTYVFMKNNVY
jgi:5'(3')-deoxyribonucleotidase